jgi:hypothetical protein
MQGSPLGTPVIIIVEVLGLHPVGVLPNRLCKVTLLSMLFVGSGHQAVYTLPTVLAAENQVTFEKIQENAYPAFIRDIAFGSVIRDGEEQVYCKVLVLEDNEIQFLDENGEVVVRKSLMAPASVSAKKHVRRDASLSHRGNFVALCESVIGYGDEIPPISEKDCTIFDETGQEKYTLEVVLEGSQGDDQFLVSDKDGSAVSTRFSYGALDFYAPDGGQKTVRLFGDVGWDKSTGGKAVFSEDGEYLAVLVGGSAVRPPGKSPANTDVWVLLFDRNGTELWRKKVDDNRWGNVAISPKGEYVFFKTFSYAGDGAPEKGEVAGLASVHLGLYGKEGNGSSFEDTSFFVFGSFCFSSKADYVALAGGDRIRLIRPIDGSITFETQLPSSARFRELLFSSDGEYLIARTEINQLFLLNMKGELVWRNHFYTGVRKTVFENGFLAFSFPYKYEVFRQIQEEK